MHGYNQQMYNISVHALKG